MRVSISLSVEFNRHAGRARGREVDIPAVRKPHPSRLPLAGRDADHRLGRPKDPLRLGPEVRPSRLRTARHPDPGPQIFLGPPRNGWVHAAALSSDGRRLAIVINSSGTLTVWDVEAGSIVHHNKRFRGAIEHVRFSDDGRRIPVFTTDGLARLFDAATGNPLGPGINLGRNLVGGDSSPDAGRLAVIDQSTRSVRVIDLVRGERLLDIPCEVDGKVPNRVWFDSAGHSLTAAYPQLPELPLPRYALPFADSAAFMQFLTGEQIDEDDGIAFVDQFTFVKNPGRYRDVFQAWKASRGDLE